MHVCAQVADAAAASSDAVTGAANTARDAVLDVVETAGNRASDAAHSAKSTHKQGIIGKVRLGSMMCCLCHPPCNHGNTRAMQGRTECLGRCRDLQCRYPVPGKVLDKQCCSYCSSALQKG